MKLAGLINNPKGLLRHHKAALDTELMTADDGDDVTSWVTHVHICQKGLLKAFTCTQNQSTPMSAG